jgi:hypothetical protein
MRVTCFQCELEHEDERATPAPVCNTCTGAYQAPTQSVVSADPWPT